MRSKLLRVCKVLQRGINILMKKVENNEDCPGFIRAVKLVDDCSLEHFILTGNFSCDLCPVKEACVSLWDGYAVNIAPYRIGGSGLHTYPEFAKMFRGIRKTRSRKLYKVIERGKCLTLFGRI